MKTELGRDLARDFNEAALEQVARAAEIFARELDNASKRAASSALPDDRIEMFDLYDDASTFRSLANSCRRILDGRR